MKNTKLNNSMKVAVLFTGGKDSTYALFKTKHNVKCLITIASKNLHSYMFHTPNINLVKLQAKALNLPLIFTRTKGKKEEELKDLKKAIKLAIKKYKIQGIISGAIESKYQKQRIDNICKDLNLKSLTPLWHIDSLEYLNSLIKNKFNIIITAISAEGLTKEWLGKQINRKTIEELKILNKKYKLHLALEGGEAETLVLDCSLFKKKLKIIKADKILDTKYSGIYLIKKIKLEKKN